MKIRITLLLENDKPVPIRDGVDKDMMEQVAQKQDQEAFNRLVGPKDKAIVEKCELVE